MIRSRALLAAVLLCTACRSSAADPPADAQAPQDAAAPPGDGAAAPPESRTDAILAAEHRRALQGVTAADQQSRDVAVRRAAARALARIGGAVQPGLLRALADEDPEVVAWGAYGLGYWCKGHERESVTALVARSLSLPREAREGARPVLDPVAAIARAVGKCGGEESEPTLVAWLAGPREQAIASAFALGDLATVRQKLREETLAALLNLAAGSASAPPVPEALYPVGRLEHVPGTVLDRLHEVATARLAAAGEGRIFAVIALGSAGEGAAPDLGRVLGTAGSFTSAERAQAAHGLGRLGKAGQRELAVVLPGLVPASDPVALTGLVGEDFNVVLAALDAIKVPPPSPARKALADLAVLPPPPGAPAAVLRRISLLRCGAAKALADADFRDKLLVGCDVTTMGGGIGMRAAVDVIGRAPITGARLAAFKERVREGEVRAREAAVKLLETHDEVEGAAALLTEALGAKESGLVATAAEVLSKQPQRAIDERAPKKQRRKGRKKVDIDSTAEPPAPAPALVKALLDALGRPSAENDPESVDTLVDAAGALALKDAAGRLEALCRSPYPTTREHAAKALALVSSEKRTCDAPAESPAPDELSHLARARVTLSLDTDAGALTLTLDPSVAPVAVTRVLDLARAGYYNGMVVHRVVPGFVAQFGAPNFDGFGGPDDKPALRCETSPLPFVPLSVGVALAGRDTGSSQLFVTQARYPRLDGNYALVGAATGPWTALAEGDVIRKVKVEP